MTIVLAGLQQGIVKGNTLFNLPSAFNYLGAKEYGQVPVSLIVTVIIFVGTGLFLRYHRAGRAIYAVGGNREAARAAGIKVDRIRIGVYVVGSVLAAVGGLMEAGRVQRGHRQPGLPGRHHLRGVRGRGDRRREPAVAAAATWSAPRPA